MPGRRRRPGFLNDHGGRHVHYRMAGSWRYRRVYREQIIESSGQGLLLDIVLGIVGGYVFTLLGAAPVTGFNLYSMFVAIVGAVIVLEIYHAVIGRGRAI